MYSKRDLEGGGRTKLISAVLVTFGRGHCDGACIQGRRNEWHGDVCGGARN